VGTEDMIMEHAPLVQTGRVTDSVRARRQCDEYLAIATAAASGNSALATAEEAGEKLKRTTGLMITLVEVLEREAYGGGGSGGCGSGLIEEAVEVLRRLLGLQ
jgi:hypothetical protein